jgi:N-acetyltransferase
MEYVKSSAEDRKLHSKFHKQNLSGYDVGETFIENTHPKQRMKGLLPTDAIIMIDAFDPYHRKRRAHAAFEIVQRELGAVEIPHDDIWKTSPETNITHREGRYRAYMYIREQKCVGYLLAERVKEAFAVLDPSSTEPSNSTESTTSQEKPREKISALAALRLRKSHLSSFLQVANNLSSQSPLTLSPKPVPAVLGISRIWVLPSHRGQKIASALLDSAVKFHNDYVSEAKRPVPYSARNADGNLEGNGISEEVHKIIFPEYVLSPVKRREEVAFSSPTESGARLARRWVGRAWGWLVYV